ncbi:hypothetical protein JZ751_028502 [Albula glossodonta]|uniref:Fibronectin type-III domain-containing protein n=1 Tax=Albula glossodonta TaxID=121402 RepID=A0A8T2MQT5_9TELE|nr:hypothetical protein JZ751_004443 [Albula glossodonta]KAG9329963.1 hypothetical protein JZ751_028502 [Albula glossodonta]
MTFISSSKSCFLLFVYIEVVLASLPVPKNVRPTCVNMEVVLEWDKPQPHLDDLTYTAEYRTSVDSNFTTVCQNQREQRCDFTKKIVSVFGVYRFRVRAERRQRRSKWHRTEEFYPDKANRIGPPAVRLTSVNGTLEVNITDPAMKLWSLRDIYSHVSYNIWYWKEGQEDKVTMRNDWQQSHLALHGLQERTRYCVQVQVFIKDFNKGGNFSRPMCETTTVDGMVKPWEVALVLMVSFLVMSVTVPLLFLLACYCRRGLKVFFPTAKLPEHLKQYLLEPSHPYLFLAMQNSSQQMELYHEVSIISECPLLAGGPHSSHTEEQQGTEKMIVGEGEQPLNKKKEEE